MLVGTDEVKGGSGISGVFMLNDDGTSLMPAASRDRRRDMTGDNH